VDAVSDHKIEELKELLVALNRNNNLYKYVRDNEVRMNDSLLFKIKQKARKWIEPRRRK